MLCFSLQMLSHMSFHGTRTLRKNNNYLVMF